MKYALALIAGISLVGATACTSATGYTSPSAAGGTSVTEVRPSLGSIVDIAVGDPNFTTLVAALSRASLVETFAGSRHYTVFAPTNMAFDRAAAALLGPGFTGLDLVNGLPLDALTAVLQYHVTLGDRNSKSVLAAGTLRMLDGNWTTIRINAGIATIDDAEISATDLRASNGYVHVIDDVILPPSLR